MSFVPKFLIEFSNKSKCLWLLFLIMKESILICFVIPIGVYWWPQIMTYPMTASVNEIFFADINREAFANWYRNFPWLQQ